MKNKSAIIGTLVLLAIFAGLGAGWYLYVKPKFDQFKQDERMQASLEETYKKLNESFGGFKPELLMDQWSKNLQPWRQARTERSAYFNYGDWYEHEKAPQEARMLKFWYGEASDKMMQDLYAKIYAKLGRYDTYPQDIRTMLNVAMEQDWQGRDVTDKEIDDNLANLAFGIKVVELLLDNNVSQLAAMSVWPKRIAGEYAEMIAIQTVGLQFSASMRDFVKLMETLRQEERYFSVDGIKITYPYIGYNVEPQIQVQLLLSQSNYLKNRVESGEGDAKPGAPGGGPAMPQMPGGKKGEVQQAPVAEAGAVAKAWKWFKNNVLYIH